MGDGKSSVHGDAKNKKAGVWKKMKKVGKAGQKAHGLLHKLFHHKGSLKAHGLLHKLFHHKGALKVTSEEKEELKSLEACQKCRQCQWKAKSLFETLKSGQAKKSSTLCHLSLSAPGLLAEVEACWPHDFEERRGGLATCSI